MGPLTPEKIPFWESMATLLRCWMRCGDLPAEARPAANSSTLMGS